MSSKRTKSLVTTGLIAAAVGVWALSGPDVDESEEAASGVVNQLWVNRMPESERDMVRYFVAIKHPEGRMGAAGAASQWRQIADLFLWSLEEDRLALYFGQDDIRWKPHAKVWRCAGEAPEPFELCLKIWDDRHSVQLYSRDEWRIEPHDDGARLSVQEPAVAHIVEQAFDRAVAADQVEHDDAPEGAPAIFD